MSLENFKKQAKLLVRWHREQNYSVGGRIRQLSRYRDLTDSEDPGPPFPTQRGPGSHCAGTGIHQLGGTERGLKKAPPSARTAPAAARLTKANTRRVCVGRDGCGRVLPDQLGFAIDFLHGPPAFYASVSRDDARIHLRFVHQPALVTGLREGEQLLSAFVAVANVKALFAEYVARNVPFVHRLKKEPWGQSSFIVRDPDGNWLCFAG